LVDCDKIDQGCGGGYMYQAYEAIMEIGGLETETDYKYEGKDDKCRFNSSEVQVKLTGAVNISQDEN
ncbi:Cathepsin F precursor, putative, partial [Biomphalaria glabrata]